jgi:hypothetical protein
VEDRSGTQRNGPLDSFSGSFLQTFICWLDGRSVYERLTTRPRFPRHLRFDEQPKIGWDTLPVIAGCVRRADEQ